MEKARDGLLAKAGVSAIRTAAEARGAPVAEDAERAVADGDQEIAVSRLNGKRAAFYAIDAAIRKFDAGTYGLCEHCGNLIPEARLCAIPETRYCVTCQDQEEMAAGSAPQKRRLRR
ncbi:MAG: TraR/DksA C4-type zinc finger protein [bacterium]|nr:TraR/DksA C4-type zinc finger protein [bacterium]